MIEIGEVTKIDGDRLTILCKPSAACHCCSGGLCGAKDREIAAHNPRGLALKIGDKVEIFLSSAHALTAGLRVLALPVGLFAALYTGAPRFFGVQGEGPQVLAGFAGLILGFLLVLFVFPGRQRLPEVVRVVSEEELQTLAASEAERVGLPLA